MEIKLNNVNYTVNKNKTIIDNLNINIKDNSITSIIGPTGSGKTTLAKLISLFIKPTNGQITFDNIVVTNQKNKENLNKLRPNIGLVYQNPKEQFFLDTVKKEIEFTLDNLNYKTKDKQKRIEDSLKLVGLNNDILSIMLATMAIFYTIKWYKSDKLKDLLKIAITISLSIMTKISTALVAVAIAFVFLFKVINNKEQLKKYIKHFTLFAIIALPIGLWFPIKNLVLYDIPITYVQSVDEDNDANISEHNILERFFTFSQEQVHTVNVLMSKENADYNLFISTLKSFIVDEQIEYSSNSILKIVVPAIFYCSIIISFFYIINLIYILKNYKKINNNWILFFLFLFILQIVSYLKFCFDYPFTFTMNFRYIVPTLVSYAVITGIASDDNKKLFYINSSLLSIFSILSILMFTNML